MSVQDMHKTSSASDHPSARHRADRTPELMPHMRPLRHAHLDRRRRRTYLRSSVILLASAVLLAVVVGSWRLDDRNGGKVVTTPRDAAPGTALGVAVDVDGNVRGSIDLVRSSASGTPALHVPARDDFDPEVRIGALSADAAQLPSGGPLRANATRQVPRAAEARRLTVEYAATGTYVASRPSSPGRGLVLLTPVHLAGDGVPGRLEVSDPRILNLACGTGVELRACGSRVGQTWVVEELQPGHDVVAQVDLGS